MTAPVCPECGGVLVIDTDAVVSEEYAPGYFIIGRTVPALPRRERRAPVAFCAGCEFCIEIRRQS